MRPETARSRRDRPVAAAMTWAASGQPRCGAGTRLFRSVWLGGKKGTRWVSDTHLLLSGRRACRSRRGPCRGLPRGGYAGEGARRPVCCGIGVETRGRAASAAIGNAGSARGIYSRRLNAQRTPNGLGDGAEGEGSSAARGVRGRCPVRYVRGSLTRRHRRRRRARAAGYRCRQPSRRA